MTDASYLLLPDGRPRAAWRLLLFIFGYVVVDGALVWLWPLGTGDLPVRMGRLVGQRILITLAISWIMLRLIEQRPFARVGIGRGPGWGAALGLGSLAGIAMVSATSGLLVLAAGLRFEPAAGAGASAAADFLVWAPFILLTAASEELLFRGYPFQILREGTGRAAAVLSTSILFGLMHAFNPEASVVSIINTALAGVMLSLACLQAGSLWYAIGLHFAWNWALGGFGLPVSGLPMPNLGWVGVAPDDSAWLHGGRYGPEAGAVVTLCVAAMSVLLLWRPRWVGCLPVPSAPPDSTPPHSPPPPLDAAPPAPGENADSPRTPS